MAHGEDRTDIRKEKKQSGFLPVRCPNSSCRHVLFEVEARSREKAVQRIRCGKCGRSAVPETYSLRESEPGTLRVLFRCANCSDDFTLAMSAMRKYCRGCKNYFILFISFPFGPESSAG